MVDRATLEAKLPARAESVSQFRRATRVAVPGGSVNRSAPSSSSRSTYSNSRGSRSRGRSPVTVTGRLPSLRSSKE